MREIKFRCWDINKMHYFDFADTIAIDEDNVMQYTGLKDKNGVEIYEGDILEMTFINIHLDLVTERAFVKWNVWNWSLFRGDKYYDNCSQILLNSRSPEVIGNIYQNPELLKGDLK